jgi:hypothetical protein
MIYKCVNELAPHYLSDLFTKCSYIYQRDTRSHDSMQLPLYKTTGGQRSSIIEALHFETKTCK